MDSSPQIADSSELHRMRANRKACESRCLTCGREFQLAEEICSCDWCHGYHHLACLVDGCCLHALPAESDHGSSPQGDQKTVPRKKLIAEEQAPCREGLKEDEKRCPDCREVVKGAALKCRFCGWIFDKRLAKPPNSAKPPTVHWMLTLLLGWMTLGIFFWVTILLQSIWVVRVRKHNKAPYYYLLAFFLLMGGQLLVSDLYLRSFAPLISLGGAILFQLGNFALKSAIESHYNFIRLSAPMVFCFSTVYFQYHFYRLEGTSPISSKNQPTSGSGILSVVPKD